MSAGDGSGHRLGVETPSGEASAFPQHGEAGWEARELQPTGLTEDGRFLLLVAADDRGEEFRVRADDRLRGLTRGATGRPSPYQPRVDSALTPREIQARLRAGQTASEVARAAGVPVERIQRYEAPVLAERGRVVEQAQAARPPVRADEPRRPLGEIVAERLGQRGITEDAVHWDASRRIDGAWNIQMTFPRDGTTVTACWLWDPAVGRVRPHDDEAAALLEPLATRPAATGVSAGAGMPSGAGLTMPVGGMSAGPPAQGDAAGTENLAAQRASGPPMTPLAPVPTALPATAFIAASDPWRNSGTAPVDLPAPADPPVPAGSPAAASAPTAPAAPIPAAGSVANPMEAASPTEAASSTGAVASTAAPVLPVDAGPVAPVDAGAGAPVDAGPVAPVDGPEASEPPTPPPSAAIDARAVPEAVPLTLVSSAPDPDVSGDAREARGGLRADRRTDQDAPAPTEEVPRRATPRATGRRGRREVPAWDDIVFGAKGG